MTAPSSSTTIVIAYRTLKRLEAVTTLALMMSVFWKIWIGDKVVKETDKMGLARTPLGLTKKLADEIGMKQRTLRDWKDNGQKLLRISGQSVDDPRGVALLLLFDCSRSMLEVLKATDLKNEVAVVEWRKEVISQGGDLLIIAESLVKAIQTQVDYRELEADNLFASTMEINE